MTQVICNAAVDGRCEECFGNLDQPHRPTGAGCGEYGDCPFDYVITPVKCIPVEETP